MFILFSPRSSQKTKPLCLSAPQSGAHRRKGKKKHCKREKCFACNTGQLGVCRRTGLGYGYRIECMVCSLLINSEYAGETKKTSQELRMLSSVTLNCQATKIVMNSGTQFSEL